MISKEEVKHIAKLARLGLAEKEIEKFQKDLSPVLDYIEKLKELDVSKVRPTSYLIERENIMRKDKEDPKSFDEKHCRERSDRFKSQSTKLLDLAPSTKDGYLKTKSIF